MHQFNDGNDRKCKILFTYDDIIRRYKIYTQI